MCAACDINHHCAELRNNFDVRTALSAAPAATRHKGNPRVERLLREMAGESWRLHLTLAPNDWSVGYSSMVLVANASSRRAAEAEGERGDEEDPLVACLYESRVCQSPALCPMGINFALFRG